MIIILFFFASFLGTVKYYKLDGALDVILGQSPEFYAWIAVCLLAFRIGMVFCKYYPMVLEFYYSVTNLSAKADEFFSRPRTKDQGASTPSDSPFKDGQKRRVHTGTQQPLPARKSWSERLKAEKSDTVLSPIVSSPIAVHSGSFTPGLGVAKAITTPLPKGPSKGLKERLDHDREIKKSRKWYRTVLLRLNFNLDNFHDLLTVKGGSGAVPILKGIALFTGTRFTKCSIRYIWRFAKVCYAIGTAQGIKGLVRYLKAAGISFQQSLGGHRVADCSKLGARLARTKGGIPRFVPAEYRILIRNGDPRAIRLTLTLINIFRILEFKGSVNTATITALSTAHGGLDRFLEGLIPLFVSLFVKAHYSLDSLAKMVTRFAKDSVVPIWKSAPGTDMFSWSTHPDVLLRSLAALKASPVLWESLSNLISLSCNKAVELLLDHADGLMELDLRNTEYFDYYVGKPYSPKRLEKPVRMFSPIRSLGKLGMKAEAAGKVRIFAMVDAWTQWVLYAYHKVIFKILEKHPMDGTFNQTAPLSRVKPTSGLWSLDLTAATDRVPLSLQKKLLAHIFGWEFATSWANLLTKRAYSLFRIINHQKVRVDLYYSVGQPMGALSSWASLAIVHHFLVQASAWRTGFPKWKLYTNYAVLGDDVVIGDKRVALSYLHIMDSLGVGINTSKSLLSHHGTALEFAKRTIFRGIDVSPVAFKEFYAACHHIGAFRELVTKTGTPFPVALQAMGVGWRVRSWLNKPLGKLSARLRLLILAINIPHNAEEVNSFFEMGKPPIRQYSVDTVKVIVAFMQREATRLFGKIHQIAPLSLGGESSYMWALKLMSATLGKLELYSDRPFIWEGYSNQSFSLFNDEALDWFSVNGIAWNLGKVYYELIHTLRVNTTAMWKEDLNRLATGVFGLMTLDFSTTIPEFSKVYLEFIKLQREFAMFDASSVEQTSRPNPDILEGILTPQQVRLWKRWSAVLQGSKVLEATGAVDASAPPQAPIADPVISLGVLPPVETLVPPLEEFLPKTEEVVELEVATPPFFDLESYQFFGKAGLHEGYAYHMIQAWSNQGPIGWNPRPKLMSLISRW